MKKNLPIVSIIIIVVCLLTTLPLLQLAMPQSQGPLQTTPGTTPQATQQSTSQPAPQSTSQPTPTSTTQSTPQNTPQQTQQNLQPASNRTLQEAVGNATCFLDKLSEPYAMLMLNVIYRRFGVVEFADSLQQYDQALAKSNSTEAPMLRVFRRIADYGNTLQDGDLKAVVAETDLLTVPALYCDRLELPSDYALKLNQAINGRDYIKTHALLAAIWLNENGYNLALPSGFYSSLYNANAALINNDSVVSDVELEAATFLYIAGQGSMVNAGFVEAVIDAQNVDGGWRLSNDAAGDSHWHTSVLGLLFLLHIQYPALSYPPMLALAPN
jgi:hypothetical protein